MAKYNIRFVDGPLKGQKESSTILYNKITRFPEEAPKGVSYYRVDNPREVLREYRYSVKP